MILATCSPAWTQEQHEAHAGTGLEWSGPLTVEWRYKGYPSILTVESCGDPECRYVHAVEELALVEPLHYAADFEKNIMKVNYTENIRITTLETQDLRGSNALPISNRARVNRAGATANIWTTLGANVLNIIWNIGSFAGAWGK